MATKYTFLFQFQTDPAPGSNQNSRVAGWSESHWRTADDLVDPSLDPIAGMRAALLPADSRIIGWRAVNYDLSQAKLIQTSVRIGGCNLQFGAGAIAQDVPQMALQMRGTVSGLDTNVATFDIRGIPDAKVVGGAYTATDPFDTALKNWQKQLAGFSWGFVGIDKTQKKVRVLALAAGVLKVASGSGIVVNDTITFYRTTLDGGKKLTGKYLVTAATDPTFTLQGIDPTATITKPNGACRRLILKFLDYASIQTVGVRTHKVGRPFFRYRGRKSAA